ncbi:MAG: hypothetical protein ABL949_07080 [Fimbriimonadaceae bacterium]
MLVLGLLLARTALGLNPTIARLPVILKDLSRVAALELQCAPEIENEVLYVNTLNQTPKAIMDEIAYTLEANWTQLEGGRTRLSRPLDWPETQRKRKEAQIERLMAKFLAKDSPKALTTAEMVAEVKRVKALRDAATKTGNDNGWYVQMAVISRQLPAGKLLDEVVRALGPKRLAQVEAWGNAVYSNSPTKMQRPLPESLNRSIAAFAAEHNAVASDLVDNQPDPPRDPWGNDNPLSGIRELPTNFRIHVKVEANPAFASIYLLAFVDGQIAAYAYRHASGQGGGPGGASEAVAESEVVQPKPGQLVPLNDLSKGYYVGRVLDQNDGPGVQINPAALDILTHPFDKEFLQITNRELLDAFAIKAQRPVIALIPDELFASTYYPAPKQEVDLNQLIRLFEWFEGAPKEHGEWTVLGRCPIARPRVSRSALQECFKLARLEKRLSLKNIAGLVAKTPPVSDYWLKDYLRESSQSPVNYWPFDLPRLYGSLSESQKKQLQSGAVLAPDSLFKPQRETLLNMLFANHSYLSTLVKLRPTPLDYWPTEQLPAGIDSLKGIKADYLSGESWFVKYEQESKGGEPGRAVVVPTQAGNLSGELAAFQRPDLFPNQGSNGADPRKTWKFNKGFSTTWDFTFLISEKIDRLGSLRDDWHDPSRTYTYAELSEGFRSECEGSVKTIIARREKLKAEGKLNPPRKGNPPPRAK